MGGWQPATVVGLHDGTPRRGTFRLRLSRPGRHRAGQPTSSGSPPPTVTTAQRSYSVASPPADGASDEIDLTVERLKGGEVSGFLHDGVEIGDELGGARPIGGWFVWEDGPALLVGGGSGVVPLMAMLRRRAAGSGPTSSASWSLCGRRTTCTTATRSPGPRSRWSTRAAPPGVVRPTGRLTPTWATPSTASPPTSAGLPGFADAASRLVAMRGSRAGAERPHGRQKHARTSRVAGASGPSWPT